MEDTKSQLFNAARKLNFRSKRVLQIASDGTEGNKIESTI